MRQLLLKRLKYFVVFIFFILNLNSCDKEQITLIPDVPVSLIVDLNIMNELTVPGNSVLFEGFGFGGVIVYCELPGSYYAFDATCTYEISTNCNLKAEGILGTCSCCGSQYVLLGGGYPSEGPATAPLKNYNVSFLNNSTLRIYN